MQGVLLKKGCFLREQEPQIGLGVFVHERDPSQESGSRVGLDADRAGREAQRPGLSEQTAELKARGVEALLSEKEGAEAGMRQREDQEDHCW